MSLYSKINQTDDEEIITHAKVHHLAVRPLFNEEFEGYNWFIPVSYKITPDYNKISSPEELMEIYGIASVRTPDGGCEIKADMFTNFYIKPTCQWEICIKQPIIENIEELIQGVWPYYNWFTKVIINKE